MVDENGRERCYSTLIYNLDLKGFLPKKIVSWAASSFLQNHVKAAQKHALNLNSIHSGSANETETIPRK